MCDNEIFIKRLKCVLVQFHEIFGQFLAILRKKSEKSRFRSVDTKSTLGRVAKKRPRPADFDRPQTLVYAATPQRGRRFQPFMARVLSVGLSIRLLQNPGTFQ